MNRPAVLLYLSIAQEYTDGHTCDGVTDNIEFLNIAKQNIDQTNIFLTLIIITLL